MSSELPFDSALNQAVQQFGLGPYDSAEEDEHGEDTNKRAPKKTLPDGGGPCQPLAEPETFQSYPTTPSTFASVRHDGSQAGYARWLWSTLQTAVGLVPGDEDRPPASRRPADDVLGPGVPSVSKTQLPSDADNPSARSDYYDRMRQGLDRAPDPDGAALWADEDSGAYAGEKKDSLPAEAKNESSKDNSLGALGNAWSGYVVDEQAGPMGFPSEDLLENVNYPRDDRDGGGYIMAAGQGRVATNLSLVEELTDAFVKAFGKKDLTRRHVMAFLKASGKSQYLASDIIRCLKLSYKVYVKDVLDEFPVAKTASGQALTLAHTRDALVELEIQNIADPDTARELRRCAASLSDVVAIVERSGVSNV